MLYFHRMQATSMGGGIRRNLTVGDTANQTGAISFTTQVSFDNKITHQHPQVGSNGATGHL